MNEWTVLDTTGDRAEALRLCFGEASPVIEERERVEYAERVIHTLSQDDANKLASLSLLGYSVKCSSKSALGNHWWHAYTPDGKHMLATGGLELSNVIRRMWKHHTGDKE